MPTQIYWSRTHHLAVGLLVTIITTGLVQSATANWKTGVAKVNITPKKLMWMSGYGGRDRPAEGKLTDLWAKALVLEDATGERCVFVTLDLIGISRDLTVPIRNQLEQQYHLDPRQVALLCSHTHTSPAVGENLRAMFSFDDVQQKLVDQYAATLQVKILAVVGQALKNLARAELSWDIGQATFAVNRRNNREADVPDLRKNGLLQGPVDHDVPVLRVRQEGKTTAILFGYACHATVLSFYQWSGDYPGFAQIELEKSHPETIALFWAGCGADQNPLPRRKVELAQEYGSRLAAAVDKVLANADSMQQIEGSLQTEFQEIDLKFDKLPSREEVEKLAKSTDKFQAGHGKQLMKQFERDGKLSPTYPYPVQTWRLGKRLIFVTLGGEVVVDFSLRLKRELAPESTWVAGYANDVMAYIPSRRVLLEGGYEGASSMRYYGQPTKWAPSVEEDVVRTVVQQAQRLQQAN